METKSLQGGTAVIIDILRASTTMITALYNGALQVVPCGTPDAARRVRDELDRDSVLLGGERGGVLIDGFDCGNSPREYPAERVAGKTIAFTTTNGTHALLQAAAANTILIGAFVNRRSIVNQLHADHLPIHLVCAGTDGEITGEDVLFAGSIVASLLNRHQADKGDSTRWRLNDCARIALAFWSQAAGNRSDGNPKTEQQDIEAVMRETKGGRNLRDLGYDADIRLCSLADSIDVVPILNSDSASLVATPQL